MELTHILVDFENVQPQEMDLLIGDRFRVMIFRGPHQTKVDFAMVESLQPLGSNVTYIRSEKHGKNALDFHIAFHLGRLLPEIGNHGKDGKGARFIVITKDGGFDALLAYVRSLGYDATRASTIGEALRPKPAASDKLTGNVKKSTPRKAPVVNKVNDKAEPLPKKTAKADILQKLLANFRQHPKNRPSTLVALERHIGTAYGSEATPSTVQKLIGALQRQGILKVSGEKIEYAAL